MDSLSGELVRLRPIKDEDFECLASLGNDTRTQARGLRLAPCLTPKTCKENIEKTFNRPNRGIWIIETKEGSAVGYVDYKEESPRLRATLGVVTGVEHWGKGFGREAMELVIRFLFEERGLQVVSLWTTSWNVRMVGLAEKLGFRISRRSKGARYLGGGIYDGLCMDMLREEYYESRGLTDGMTASRRPAGG